MKQSAVHFQLIYFLVLSFHAIQNVKSSIKTMFQDEFSDLFRVQLDVVFLLHVLRPARFLGVFPFAVEALEDGRQVLRQDVASELTSLCFVLARPAAPPAQLTGELDKGIHSRP